MTTFTEKPADVVKKWYIIDAEDLVLGRLASEIAKILRGKHKPTFTPHIDCGDNVIVINAAKIHLTGNKLQDKTFFWHTGYAGGIKEINPAKQLAGDHPERLLERAVKRMISRTALGNKQMTHLKVYAGSDHPHQGIDAIAYDFGAKNPKNKRRA